jgi:hypothetical protein
MCQIWGVGNLFSLVLLLSSDKIEEKSQGGQNGKELAIAEFAESR